MKERFVPCYYKRDLFVKLQKFQGSKSVKEFDKDMEVTPIRAQIIESQETTMARILNGLNRDIQHIVEFHEYTSISTLVTKPLRHGKKSYPTTSSNWKDKERREDESPKWEKSPKKGSAPFKGHKDEVNKVSTPNSNSSKSSNIECFKCLLKGHISL
ncbi:hypothetical protein CR513_36949, partial [Mucuna pruriens]